MFPFIVLYLLLVHNDGDVHNKEKKTVKSFHIYPFNEKQKLFWENSTILLYKSDSHQLCLHLLSWLYLYFIPCLSSQQLQ